MTSRSRREWEEVPCRALRNMKMAENPTINELGEVVAMLDRVSCCAARPCVRWRP